MILDNGDVICPLCQTTFIPQDGGGECIACGNPYDIYYNNGMQILTWGSDGDRSFNQQYEIVHDSKMEHCPNCKKEYKKVMTNTERYFIIRKKCVCGTEDEEVIKK